MSGATETTLFQSLVGKERSIAREVSLQRIKVGVSWRSAWDHEVNKEGGHGNAQNSVWAWLVVSQCSLMGCVDVMWGREPTLRWGFALITWAEGQEAWLLSRSLPAWRGWAGLWLCVLKEGPQKWQSCSCAGAKGRSRSGTGITWPGLCGNRHRSCCWISLCHMKNFINHWWGVRSLAQPVALLGGGSLLPTPKEAVGWIIWGLSPVAS